MGGAADLPHRSSSPLKRRAEELDAEAEAEAEAQSSQKDDVDMIVVPESDPLETIDASTRPTHPGRTQSIDMLREEPDASASDSTAQAESTVTAVTPNSDIPPIDTQIKTVTTLCEAAGEAQLNEGDKVYLVSQRWLDRVISRGSEARQKSKIEPEGEIGPVDNSDMIQQIFTDFNNKDFVQLKHGVGQESYVMFPEDAWNLVVEWYGLMPGHIPIIRIAHNTNPDKTGVPNMQYEIHPPIFVIHRLWSDPASLLSQSVKVANPDAPVFVFSRTEKYVDFLKHIKRAAQVDPDRKIRVWRVPRAQPAAESAAPAVNTVTPPSSRPNSESGSPGGAPLQEAQDSWPKLLLDVVTFSKVPKGEGRELVETADHSVNQNYNGNSDIGFTGLGDSQAIVIDECVDGKEYVMNYSPKTSKTPNVATRSTALVPQTNSQTNSGRNSPAPSGPMTRGRAQRNGRTPGTVGLSNLGNTCYMNSALQCVRSVEELTKYFLAEAALEELNKDNPLGNNGDVATAYFTLLKEIYSTKQTSVAPRMFKNTIGRYAPSFSGYGQQDSQEFLGFLLDGLQEDLSRVKKKPYIEKPDSTDEMVNNPEAIREMAAKVWDITKKRDDSVIADLFTGMYKSTLVCPVCAKVSITFDPFNNLTLQLPIENSWTHQIYFFPLNDKPIIIIVDIDKQASILAMKHYLSKKVGVPVERLFVAEEFKSKFYKIYDDYNVASDEISTNDIVTVYELEAKPTNWPNPNKSTKKQKSYSSHSPKEALPNWDSPLADKLLVPVFYRRPNRERSRYGTKRPWEVVPVPHFIMVTPEEARNEDMIKKKILEKLATFSTHPDFLDEDEEANDSVAESVDPDLVLTNGSDSSGDKVVANSIDGDDELVDVTMKESNGVSELVETDSPKASETDASKSCLIFNKRRPKFMQPGAFIDGQFQNMFELCYFSTNEFVPAGWQAVDEDKSFPRISSRNPQLHQVDEPEDDHDMTNGRAASESSNEDDRFHPETFSSTTRMNEESSDEDELAAAPVSRDLPVRPAGPKYGVRVGPNRRRPTRIKTYSRKGNQPARKLSETRNSDQDAPDDGPLIRLGEGIVVDWTTEAYDQLFEGAADDTMRGQNTWVGIPTWTDPELVAKKQSRAERRKNGITLEDCLNEFGKEEILSEADTWYCPRCKEHRRATKKFELWKTSDILVMHLKRFSSSTFRRDKLEVLVDFPIEGLDLTSRVIEKEDGKSEIYDLFAVDDHWGGLGGGHYTAFAKNYNDDKWYEYNDSSVSEVKDVSRVVSPAAYLLFYRRRSEAPLGGPRVQEIISRFDKPETSEDDEADSGEGQGLVVNSSPRGSSSALTGVGAALHQASGSGATGQMTTVNPQDLDQLPAYQAHENEDDAAHLLQRDADMNEGLGLQNSIEDEGVDMSMGYNMLNYTKEILNFTPVNQKVDRGFNATNFSHWNFNNLNGLSELENNHRSNYVSGRGSQIDLNDNSGTFDPDGSDVVQHDSSASEGSLRDRLDAFEHVIPVDDDGDPFEDPSPVPDVDDENQLDTLELHRELIRSHNRPPPEFQVHAADQEEEIEEPATEIHIEDGEELKMD